MKSETSQLSHSSLNLNASIAQNHPGVVKILALAVVGGEIKESLLR